MTTQEIQAILKAEGWTYLPRLRKGRSYIYAQRKIHGKKIERYICSMAALAGKTVHDILEKLNSSAVRSLVKRRGSSDQATDHQNGLGGSCMPAFPIIPAIG